MFFVGTCSGFVILDIKAELVGIEIRVTSVADTFSVVSVLFLFGFKLTEIDCVSGQKPDLFEVIARVIILGKIYK